MGLGIPNREELLLAILHLGQDAPHAAWLFRVVTFCASPPPCSCAGRLPDAASLPASAEAPLPQRRPGLLAAARGPEALHGGAGTEEAACLSAPWWCPGGGTEL